MTAPDVYVQTAAVEISALPNGHKNRGHFTIRIERRSDGRWAVIHLGEHLSRAGTWDLEPRPLDTHLFTYDEALALAKLHAWQVTVNGYTAAAYLTQTGETR